MELFDFYKLLEIPVGTPIGDIKKAYMLKVHQLSVAYKDGDEKASEYIDVITQGYQLLSDPEKKRIYDLMLLRYYLKQEDSEIQRSFYKKFGHSERNILAEEAEYKKGKQPDERVGQPDTLVDTASAIKGIRGEKIQLMIAGLLLMVLTWFFHVVFWRPYTEITMVLYVFLGISYVVLMLWTLMKLYRYFEVRNIILQRKVSTEKWVLVSFLVMFFAMPLLVMRAENLRKDYHLKHFSATVRADDFMLEDKWLTVDYTVNNQKYKQTVTLGDQAEYFRKYYFDRARFLIRYSSEDPKIITVETGK